MKIQYSVVCSNLWDRAKGVLRGKSITKVFTGKEEMSPNQELQLIL